MKLAAAEGNHAMPGRLRRLAASLIMAGAASVALAFPAPALAGTYEPDPAVPDSLDANPFDGVCANSDGLCSLRAAVHEVSIRTPEESSAATSDTIVLARGTYQLTVFGSLSFTGPRRDRVAVVGAGRERTTIEQTGEARVLSVLGDLAVDLSGVTVTGGNVTRPPGAPPADLRAGAGGGIYTRGKLALHHVRINGNRAEGFGGGIFNDEVGFLELDDVIVRGNEAAGGGGIASLGRGASMARTTVRENVANGTGSPVPAGGGGVMLGIPHVTLGFTRQLEIHNSLVVANRAEGGLRSDGGGLAIFGRSAGGMGEAHVVDTTFRGNRAGDGADAGNGGAIVNRSFEALRVERSTLVRNVAQQGGGLSIEGLGRFTNSTLSENRATDTGGAIFQRFNSECATLLGGGERCVRNGLLLESSTLAGNTADASIDGIAGDGRETLRQAVGTIFANAENCDVPIEDSIGWNLETGISCDLDGTGDLSSADPSLGPLADNGGATWTHAVGAGSPAIDANAFSRCPDLDQRTARRPAGARCDIGSFERGALFFGLRAPEPRFIGGVADIELLPLFATSLAKEGISLEPAGGAEGDAQGTGLSFDIGGGTLRGRHAALELGGWLILRGPDRTLGLSHPVAVLNGKRGFLAMTLGLEGRRVRLFDLTGVQRGEPKGEHLALAGEATLAPAGASLLRRELGAKLPAGAEVGRLQADVALVPPSTDPGPIQEPIEPPGQ